MQFSYKELHLNETAMAADRFCWLLGHCMGAASATGQVGFEAAVRFHLLYRITAGLALALVPHVGRLDGLTACLFLASILFLRINLPASADDRSNAAGHDQRHRLHGRYR
jgi:hypothetical protein